MSMALPSYYYKNPEEVYIRNEDKTCKGCRHEQRIEVFERKIIVCKFNGKKHGKRCKSYEVNE